MRHTLALKFPVTFLEMSTVVVVVGSARSVLVGGNHLMLHAHHQQSVVVVVYVAASAVWLVSVSQRFTGVSVVDSRRMLAVHGFATYDACLARTKHNPTQRCCK